MEKKLTPDEQREMTLSNYWGQKFKEAMVHKAPYTRKWQQYWDAYYGDYFKNSNLPDYKSNAVSNYIFSIIETIRPIMLDNNPKFQAIPRHPEGLQYSNDVQEMFSYEWDRESMTKKLQRELITTLVTGNSVVFVPWNRHKKNVNAIWINPFNFFADPLATCIDDSEYNIYASYYNAEFLKRKFPKKAHRLTGSSVNYGELVHNNNQNANITNQILVLEIWTRDYETKQDESGQTLPLYPKGRVLTLCPEVGVVLEDKQNPYSDGNFPFEILKDYDVPGKFWGEGEVAQLLSPQKNMNDLHNAIIDNAKMTANNPWIIDRNSGIEKGSITSRPGLVIRKNPGTEVRREQAPNMPNYVVNAVETFKGDMEQVSGIFDSIKGNSETGVYTAQGVLALQEAGQARVRLKVKIMEDLLGRVAKLWYSRIKQFWKDERFIRTVRADGSYNVTEFRKDALNFDYDIRITAGSTMPVNRGAMLDLMIRLAQTPMPDGQNIVDREAVVQYLPEEVKSSVLRRMNETNTQLQQQVEQLTQQLQQFVQQDQQDDQNTMSTLEQITGAIEKVNKQILQLQKEHDRMIDDKKREEEKTKIRNQAYNDGYKDAESMMMDDEGMSDMSMSDTSDTPPPVTEDVTDGQVGEELPDDILTGLESMSDDELALLAQQNPDLMNLIK